MNARDLDRGVLHQHAPSVHINDTWIWPVMQSRNLHWGGRGLGPGYISVNVLAFREEFTCDLTGVNVFNLLI